MSLKFGPIHRRGFIKALGSAGLAASAWSLRLVPEFGTARNSLAQAAGPSMDGHPLSKFKSVRHLEAVGDAQESAQRAILTGDDVQRAAKAAGFDPATLSQGKVGYEVDSTGRTVTVGTWIIDDKQVLIYASADRRLEWFKSMSMVVTTDAEIGQVKAYTLNGSIPSSVKPTSAQANSPVADLTNALGVTDAEASSCCGAYYNCCYDRWGNWQEYWHWTGMSPCGVDWGCAARECGVPCAAACVVPGWAPCVACIVIVCGFAAIDCTYWCPTCYYCYTT